MDESIASMLLNSAREDAKALHALTGFPDIADAILGFHAQQAVEKAIKSVLAAHGVAFRRTHDIAELLDLMADSDVPAPPFSESLDELNPFAVEARYGLIGPGSLDRDKSLKWTNSVLMWAASQIGENE